MGKRVLKRKPSTTSKKKKAWNNAESVTHNGYNFKSKLEKYTYDKLKENNIKAEYEGKCFTIVDAFIYKNRKLRPITYTPDFVGKNFIIECKGFPNISFPLRWKLFQLYLYKNNLDYDLYIPHNRKEVDEVINQIKNVRIQEDKQTVQAKRRFKFFSFLV